MATQETSNDDDDKPKRFRIQRKRLGSIKFIEPNGEFGFIEGEDFRDDVFFHRTVWEGPLSDATKEDRPLRRPPERSSAGPGFQRGNRPEAPRPSANAMKGSLVGMFVEFEIDDEIFFNDQKLRATVARPTERPRGRKLSGRDATYTIVTHHPNARRKRPNWRGE